MTNFSNLKGGSKGFLTVVILLKRVNVTKKVFLTMWANYEYLNNSFVGQYNNNNNNNNNTFFAFPITNGIVKRM